MLGDGILIHTLIHALLQGILVLELIAHARVQALADPVSNLTSDHRSLIRICSVELSGCIHNRFDDQ